ncbi:hypothetical protein C9374_009324 [Naegleria lovaniensis]|uniref:Ubiquitin-like protease family profile domain-containing protein n=1 Tax=Naegleria lovaniensis TaxID=51637 RepID=A0AA88KH35_NAELO|nr:uncharacterized protein C9374_009324 [Naegleria lovaniensis]KAG2377413.1 hypothetical protein C9374_009324 [Naegleria lovaniensis]
MSQKRPSWLSPNFSKTFYDSQTLSDEDILLLTGKHWLNDNMINFYFLYLENEKYKEHQNEYCFMAPSVSFWVSMIEDEQDIKAALDPLKVQEKQLIFIPINDNTDIEAVNGGGSHWSLVVFERKNNQQEGKCKFYYFDSGGAMNKRAAQKCIEKMAPHFGDCGALDVKLVVKDAPQQNNGYDCGVYVAAMSDYIAEHGVSDSNIDKVITPSFVTQLRKDMLDLVEKKTKEN